MQSTPQERPPGILRRRALLGGGASLALLGGYALDAVGVGALALGATAIVLLPVVWLLRRPEPSVTVPEAR